MDLLNYTKKLYKKIEFYDGKVKGSNFDKNNPNPFCIKEPVNLTIIWVQEYDKKL